MEVSNIIGTYTDHNEGLKTIHKPVFNLDDIFKLKTYIGDMELVKRDSEHTKKN